MQPRRMDGATALAADDEATEESRRHALSMLVL